MSTTKTSLSKRFIEWVRDNQSVIALYIALTIMAIPFVLPFWWMITSSLKPANEIFSQNFSLFPQNPRWENFVEVFSFQPFAQQYWNSFYIALLVTAGTLFSASLAGYAFARLKFWGSGVIFIALLSALMMPSEVTIIPNFTFMQKIGWTDTHIPLIILPIVGSQGIVSTFIMRQYFLGIPKELEEAAMLDGLSRWGIYWRIAMPLAKPALSAIAILAFLNSWNLFLEPLVFVNEPTLFTLPLALRGFTDEYGQSIWNLQLAATTMSVVPVLIVYIFAQRHVVESFAFTGTKG
jgi:multiple sugar transport system permease protein